MSDRVHKITTMGTDAPHEGPEASDGSEGSGGSQQQQQQQQQQPHATAPERSGIDRTIDRVLAIQRPVVLAHLRGIRRRVPNATPEQLVRILERRYLAAVTTGGAAVGATAVIPGIGTGITLTLSGIETAGFLEATALFAQSVAEVHGIPIENPERARALVMTLMLGNEGSDLVRQFASQAGGGGVARNAYWGELITNTLPKAAMGTVVDRLRTVFVKQFAIRGGGSFIGKALPFGVGAAIGGIGNHVLGRRVLTQSRLAFGATPAVVPLELEPREGDGMIGATGRGVARASVAIAGVATASARGIRRAGAATGRATRGAITRTRRRHGESDSDTDTDTDSEIEIERDPTDPAVPGSLGGD